MKGTLQAVTIFCLSVVALLSADPPKRFTWDPPKITQSMFTRDIGMLDTERDDYATNLAIYAANQIAAQKANSSSLADARRVLGLALHLSPRNKRAVVLNFQLAKGMIPETTQGNYSSPVLARLLLTRGQLLNKQGGEENKKLARYFIQMAADMDPKNDDAVYNAEVLRLDQGDIDWAPITTEPKRTAPSPTPLPPARSPSNPDGKD